MGHNLLFLCILLRLLPYHFAIDDGTALFLFGDSSTARLYHYGLKHTFNCNENDPKASLVTEIVYNYNTPPLLCSGHGVSRIGFMFHWVSVNFTPILEICFFRGYLKTLKIITQLGNTIERKMILTTLSRIYLTQWSSFIKEVLKIRDAFSFFALIIGTQLPCIDVMNYHWISLILIIRSL